MSKKELTPVENNISSVFVYKIVAYRVIDGDTIEVMIDKGFNEFKRMNIRLQGVDTPELRIPEQKEAALIAKAHAEKVMAGDCNWLLRTKKMDLYGRWLGVIWSARNEFSLNLNNEMKKFPKE